MADPEYWKRRYERAEAGRLEALGAVRDATARMINTAADDQQAQIDALEQLVLNRAALIAVTTDGRKLILSFTRRGQVHRLITYADMATSVDAIRKTLLED